MKLSRDQILNTTLTIAKEIGWANTSVREISKRIRYSTIKIYSEFGNKDNLFIELQKRGFEVLRQVYVEASESGKNAEEQLHAICQAHLEFSFTHRTYYEIMFSLNGASCKGELGPTLKKTSEPVRAALEKIDGGASTEAFFNWWSLLHGFVVVTQNDASKSRKTKSEILRVLVQNLIKGLR
ncbi:MAG: TetR/AcrR family transcriptional regulator [Cyclobacteriaceae bacterium]|jgi:AcrR family transcriptional regulator|nr:TetR/AcrR family transcriptional regulator [Flammeovirgaceae bacterium]